MNTYYTDMIDYGIFLLDEHMEKLKLNMFIKECIINETSNDVFKDMAILNEGFTDKVKQLATKLGNLIMNMWKKFINNMDILFKKDKSYLEKYKDIILKKKLKETTYTMYDYPNALKKLSNMPVPQIQINDDNFIKNAQSEDTFIQSYLKNFTKKYRDEETFKDQVKNFTRGSSEIEIAASKINMADMYQYCYDFNKIKTKFDNDLKTFKSSYEICRKAVEQAGGTAKTESFNIFYNENRSYYSYIKEAVIYEEDNTQSNTTNNSNNNSTTSNNTQSSNNDSDGKESNTFHQQNQNVNNNKDEDVDPNDKVNQEKLDQMYKAIETYYKVSSQFLASKMDILQDCYNFYIKFIRNHVKNYVGNKGKEEISDDRGKQANTDYSDNPFDNTNTNQNNNQ